MKLEVGWDFIRVRSLCGSLNNSSRSPDHVDMFQNILSFVEGVGEGHGSYMYSVYFDFCHLGYLLSPVTVISVLDWIGTWKLSADPLVCVISLQREVSNSCTSTFSTYIMVTRVSTF